MRNNRGSNTYTARNKKGFNNQNAADPSSNALSQSMVQTTGTSVGTSGQEFTTVKSQPDVPVVTQIQFTLTADATAGNETAVIPIIPQYNTDAFPAGIVFTSSQFTAAEFIQYFSTLSCVFGRLQVDTDNNLNWGKQLRFQKWLPSGQKVPTYITWNQYKNLTYLDQTTRVIPYTGWLSGSLFMQIRQIGMRVSSVMNFQIDIASIGLPKDYVSTSGL